MTTPAPHNPLRYCGRIFTTLELTRIRDIISEVPKKNRTAISRIVCQEFDWYKRDGGLKEMSCRVALLRMHRDGIITLPVPQKTNIGGNRIIARTTATDPLDAITNPAGHLFDLRVELVDTKTKSRLWNEYIDRYHYLGHAPLPGAQLRFFVWSENKLLALLGFGAAAWCVAPRDAYIGWSADQRKRNLHLVVNNARFLILPWVTSRNLASMILATTSKALPALWEKRYGYRPVLLETFVESPRFRGTCYKAANWKLAGTTKGRGKLDMEHNHVLPLKDILLYPLNKNFRTLLTA